MIIVTGGAGFIGSCLVGRLNRSGQSDILVVDELDTTEKWRNLRSLSFHDYLDKSQLPDILPTLEKVSAIVHMGACSATTEKDAAYLMENNYRYTLALAELAVERGIRFIYAGSAATYGDGSLGYSDDEARIHELRPLNIYGYSKQVFDLRARREGWLSRMAGLKFFNVYGPNEYHKGDMVSVVYKAFCQIQETGRVRLFRSHHPDYEDGCQQRDFIYVKDVVECLVYLLDRPDVNGLFNLGTGRARTFKDLAVATFAAMGKPVAIDYVDIPVEIRDRYQYYTQAEMEKLRDGGYTKPMYSLEDGIADYVREYLKGGPRYF